MPLPGFGSPSRENLLDKKIELAWLAKKSRFVRRDGVDHSRPFFKGIGQRDEFVVLFERRDTECTQPPEQAP
jgi:hypothetical protein